MSGGLVIIGSGLAGYMVAKEWRKYDTSTPLTIVTQSDGNFYSKPLLSTALTSQRTPEVLPTSSATQMAEQLHATILTRTRVDEIQPENKKVIYNGGQLEYDQLVLALGADTIKPAIIGNAADQIISVNNLEEYSEFREKLDRKVHVTILGAGLVGCEFANDLVNVQHPVDVVALCSYPLDRLVTPDIGEIIRASLEQSGVHWRLSQSVERMDQKDKNILLTLNNGETLKTDVVLSAIGLRPHINLAKEAGLRVNRGILVDNYLSTSMESIYALGDCAEVCGHVLQYVAPLLACSRALAKTLIGEKTEVIYPAMPVVLKTPACPLVVSPPPQDLKGEWRVSGTHFDCRALFYDTAEQLRGFALTGTMVKERADLQKLLPPIFS